MPLKHRLLTDDEKVYETQRLWTSTNSKFILVKKSEYSENNNYKVFKGKSLFRSTIRQSIDQDSSDGKIFLCLKKSIILNFLCHFHRSSC